MFGGLVGGDVGDWSEDWSSPAVAMLATESAMSGCGGGMVGGDVGDWSAAHRGTNL
jgi:hypothetical protein